MKKLFIPLLSVLFFSCSSEQKKAEKSVTTYLKRVLNDPSSYESVKFDSLTVDSSSLSDDKAYKKATGTYDIYKTLFKEKKDEVRFSTDADELRTAVAILEIYSDSMKLYHHITDSLIDNFKPKKIGYVIHHSYRGRNSMNALILQDDNFHLDSLFNVKEKE